MATHRCKDERMSMHKGDRLIHMHSLEVSCNLLNSRSLEARCFHDMGKKASKEIKEKGLYIRAVPNVCVCDLAQVWLSSGVRQLQAIQSSRQDLRRSQPHEPWHNWTMLFNVLPYWTHLCIMVQMHSLPLCIQSRAASSLTPLHWNLRSNCRSSRSVQPSSQSLYHTQDWFLAAKVVKGCQRIVKVYECHWMFILIRIDSSYFVIQVSCTGA